MARLAELTKEEKAKLNRVTGANSNLDPEWLIISEFGGYFGYRGIEAILNNEIDRDVVEVLIEGQRKVWAARTLDIAEATLASATAAQAGKKLGSVFRTLTKEIIKKMKVPQ